MTPKQIETSVLEALDAGDEPTLELYAEFAAGHIDMNALTESLCLAIINASHGEWAAILGGCMRCGAQDVAEALSDIERHIESKRKPFAAARASGIDDASEHDRHLLADLQRELNGVNHE